MAVESPFGQRTRQRVLARYFESAGEVTAANAWQHVYRTLLWLDERTGLAHIYDSNHMQPGGNFYARAVRFTESLCHRFGMDRNQLGAAIDYLFGGCVDEMLRAENTPATVGASKAAAVAEQEDSEEAGLALDDSGFLLEVQGLLLDSGMESRQAATLAAEIDRRARTFFTIGKKRQNVLGEGFEDMLVLLLGRVSMVPAGRIRVRTAVTELPGFQRASRVPVLGRSERVPRPDIAIINDTHTNAIITAKWSMRQDREMQFVHEYSAYEKLKLQSPALRFYLITNEFDVARLDNVARAQPDTRGYIFHTIYHVSSELLRETQGSQVGAVDGWITAGKIASLSDFLHEMGGSYGTAPAQQDRTGRRPRGAR